ncbi:hypothetical protein M9Y10_030025 [Tritrichomonas musculus]|uniref:DUF3447 domain-containing protein n=1 Tax=Tritrichomonas musculus TaxID=1915356 RepID=A0ABR2KP63_9EUKA
MEIKNYLDQKKDFQNNLLAYLDNEDCDVNEIGDLLKYFNVMDINENRDELALLIEIIAQISYHHHRLPNFFVKLENILTNIKDALVKNFTNNEIYQFFCRNDRIICFLLKNQVIIPDPLFSNKIIRLTETIKNQQEIEIGENEQQICQIIRIDSIKEFVCYVTKLNYNLKSGIKPSNFETNLFLIEKEATLIEYAAFYGSIQIFNYLRLNGIELKPSIWLYAIHGRNADLIHLLESFEVPPPNDSFIHCFNESVKCYHNELSNYFLNNHINVEINRKFYSNCIKFLNFEFYPEELFKIDAFYNLCACNLISFIKIVLNDERVEINQKMIGIDI